MTETVTLTRDELQTLIRQEVAQQTRRGSASSDDALLAEAAGQPPRSYPLRNNREQMAAQAEIRGGVWHPEYADIRKNKKCTHANPTQCDKCWTPETEARWAYALGLTDEPPSVALDPEEPLGQGMANAEKSSDYAKRHGNPGHRRSQ